MPIYEYYCSRCRGIYRHFARTFDVETPPCPECGSRDAEKVVSTVNVGRSERERRQAFDQQARQSDTTDLQAAARVLQEGGTLTDEVVPLGMERDAFRAIVARRAEGATDEDLQDIVDELPLSELPDHLTADAHDHDHKEHDHVQGQHPGGSRREVRDLGWVKGS
ncbi:MAG: FmdB family zinc ribbon protein [Anaerolineales bacterium]